MSLTVSHTDFSLRRASLGLPSVAIDLTLLLARLDTTIQKSPKMTEREAGKGRPEESAQPKRNLERWSHIPSSACWTIETSDYDTAMRRILSEVRAE